MRKKILFLPDRSETCSIPADINVKYKYETFYSVFFLVKLSVYQFKSYTLNFIDRITIRI